MQITQNDIMKHKKKPRMHKSKRVKFTLELAMKPWRGSSSIALSFL